MRVHNFLALAAALLMACGTSHAATILASADTILLNNGGDQISPGFDSDQEDNFGGRTELFGSSNGANPRTLLFRFDPTSVAADIMAGNAVTSASFTIYGAPTNRAATINPDGSTRFGVWAVDSANAGWVEGTGTGSAVGYTGQEGSVSRAYKSTPLEADITGATEPAGSFWLSGQQFNNLAGTPAPNSDATATSDSSAFLGLGTFVDSNVANTAYTIELDAVQMTALLTEWLADPTGNAGLVLDRTAGPLSQFFFASLEGPGNGPPAQLDVTFVPEPGTVALSMLALAGVSAAGMRKRLG